MTYNVRDSRGRFTKTRHSLRDSKTGRFVSESVNRHSLRDEAGRFRAAKKYNVRDERGRFVEVNYRHNLRDPLTGRFVSAQKTNHFPWDDTYDNEEDFWSFIDEINEQDDEEEFEPDWEWGVCGCPDEERVVDVDDDGTRFCTVCLGDLPLEMPAPKQTQEEDVILLIVLA